MQVPIRQVSYTGADTKDKKLFAFVSNNNQTNQMFCHCFKALDDVCSVFSFIFIPYPWLRRCASSR